MYGPHSTKFFLRFIRRVKPCSVSKDTRTRHFLQALCLSSRNLRRGGWQPSVPSRGVYSAAGHHSSRAGAASSPDPSQLSGPPSRYSLPEPSELRDSSPRGAGKETTERGAPAAGPRRPRGWRGSARAPRPPPRAAEPGRGHGRAAGTAAAAGAMPQGGLGAGDVPGPQGASGPRRRGPGNLRAGARGPSRGCRRGRPGQAPPPAGPPGAERYLLGAGLLRGGRGGGRGGAGLLARARLHVELGGRRGGGGGPTAPRAARPRPSGRPAPRGSRDNCAGPVLLGRPASGAPRLPRLRLRTILLNIKSLILIKLL